MWGMIFCCRCKYPLKQSWGVSKEQPLESSDSKAQYKCLFEQYGQEWMSEPHSTRRHLELIDGFFQIYITRRRSSFNTTKPMHFVSIYLTARLHIKLVPLLFSKCTHRLVCSGNIMVLNTLGVGKVGHIFAGALLLVLRYRYRQVETIILSMTMPLCGKFKWYLLLLSFLL